MANFIVGIISLSVSAVVLANVFIVAVKNHTECAYGNCSHGANPGNWSGAEAAMWGLLTLIAIVGFVFGVMNVFGIG